MNFPYKINNYPNLNESINLMFENLKKVKVDDRIKILETKPFYPMSINKEKALFNVGRGKKVFLSFAIEKEDYEKFNVLPDLFNEEVRINYVYLCLNPGKNINTLLFWKHNKKEITNFAKDNYKYVNNFSLRESIYLMFNKRIGEYPNYKVVIAYCLFKYFNVKSIFDPSVGTGSRFIAALACNAKYVGCDPDSRLFKGYDKIKEMFDPNNTSELYNIGIENFEYDKVCDMTFVCPPFFKMAKYSNDDSQADNKYPNEKEWFTNFMIPLIDKSIQYTKKNGILAICYSYPKKSSLVYNMLNYIDSKNLIYLGIINHNFGMKNSGFYSPIFCWKIV